MLQNVANSGAGRFKHAALGDIQVTTVADGVRNFPLPDGFILNATREEINAALRAASLPADEITIPFNPVIVTTESHRVLIDAGNGAQAALAPGATNGLLMASLAAASIDPDSIDIVIISHFHGDHVMGLVAPEGGPAFPRARIVVPAPEWNFWMDDSEMARAQMGRMAQLFQANRRIFQAVGQQVSQYEWGEEIIPGITAVGTPGHSIGHTSFVIASGSRRMFVQSDLTNHPALFMPNPGWHAAFDQDAIQAEATRRSTLDMLATEKMLVQGFHFPFPSRGFIEKRGAGYRLIPSD